MDTKANSIDTRVTEVDVDVTESRSGKVRYLEKLENTLQDDTFFRPILFKFSNIANTYLQDLLIFYTFRNSLLRMR